MQELEHWGWMTVFFFLKKGKASSATTLLAVCGMHTHRGSTTGWVTGERQIEKGLEENVEPTVAGQPLEEAIHSDGGRRTRTIGRGDALEPWSHCCKGFIELVHHGMELCK